MGIKAQVVSVASHRSVQATVALSYQWLELSLKKEAEWERKAEGSVCQWPNPADW